MSLGRGGGGGDIFRWGVLFSRKSYSLEGEYFWGGRFTITLARPQVGKLVVACHWSAVNTIQNLAQLYVLVSSARPTAPRDMTCTMLKGM